LFDPEPEVGCRLPIKQLDELQELPVRNLFDVGTEVGVQVFFQSVVVVQACCRCSDVVVVRCRCSGSVFGVLLFGVR